MKLLRLGVIAAGLLLSTVASQAALSFDFSNLANTGIQITGSTFQIQPQSGPQFKITGEDGGSSLVELEGGITGSWTIQGVTTINSYQQRGSVTGTGNLFINDGHGGTLNGKVTWGQIDSFYSTLNLNAELNINVTDLTYTKVGGYSNADLQALVNYGQGKMNLTFQFPYMLNNLGGSSTHQTSLSGSYTAVPEPSTVVAGALLLLPFGVSSIRVLRKNRN